MNIADFIPPVLTMILKRITISKLQSNIFSSYNEAIIACPNGYNDDYLSNVVFEKTISLRDKIYMESKSMKPDYITCMLLILTMLAQEKESLKIVDFGGACGSYYFIAKHFMPNGFKLKWHVVETPAMVSKGKKLEDNELKFYTDLAKATNAFQGADLLFSSSSLPYVPDPRITIDDILHSGPRYIFLTRLPLIEHQQENIITIQTSKYSENGPGPLPEGLRDGFISYPITLISKEMLESRIRERYNILFRFEAGAMHNFRGIIINEFGYFASVIPDEKPKNTPL